MGPIYVLASLAIVGMILIASISMFSSGTGSTAIAEERMERRQAKLDQRGSDEAGEADKADDAPPPPTPLPTASRRELDDAA